MIAVDTTTKITYWSMIPVYLSATKHKCIYAPTGYRNKETIPDPEPCAQFPGTFLDHYTCPPPANKQIQDLFLWIVNVNMVWYWQWHFKEPGKDLYLVIHLQIICVKSAYDHLCLRVYRLGSVIPVGLPTDTGIRSIFPTDLSTSWRSCLVG